ncbi:tyrosine protein phosphatase [Lentibacillus halophilus]|uniref:Tyrosine-protein phosphatase n=1 Tax=Lentibacillus halophilus TaxID=295065 RepID=A0ABN0Z5Q2_9BACI
MIDIHSHILPGIDDGADTLTDSLAMAREAVRQGITAIIATPHHRNGYHHNAGPDIIRYTDDVNDAIRHEGIPLTVLPGQETRINGDMLTELAGGDVATLNGTKYVFVEFPSNHVPRYAERMLFDIQLAGYIPVIVHPERNTAINEDPSILYDLVDKGALTQLTAASIAGTFGKKLQTFAHDLVEANLTHFIASDAHNTTTRGFVMNEAYHELGQQHGREAVYTFMGNAQLLIDGETVHKDEPEPIKKKKFLGLF